MEKSKVREYFGMKEIYKQLELKLKSNFNRESDIIKALLELLDKE